MPEQPYVITAKRFEDFKRQMQQLLDDLYNERIAGALVGDVFQLDNQSDVLKLNLDSAGGLVKNGTSLAIKPNPTGPIALSSSGVDVALVSTTKKGAIDTLPNDDTKFYNGKGNWVVPSLSTVTQNITVVTDVGPPLVTATLHFTNGVLTSVS